MNTSVIERIKYNLAVMTNTINRPFFGYRLSKKSQRQWAEYERQERIKKAVLAKARQMIEWSYAEYHSAKAKNKGNIKVFTDLTLNWSPERVMSKHKDFKSLCRALKDEKIWKSLSRQERRFIADAVNK